MIINTCIIEMTNLLSLISPPSSILDNGKLLGDRLALAESHHRQALNDMRDCNNKFRALDRDLNTLRPDLMRLQWEKDQYTRY